MSVRRPSLELLAAVALLLAALPARAQEAASVSVGVAFSVSAPTNADAGTDVGPSILFRLRSDHGFGPSLALNWFTTPLHTEVDGQRVELGKISVRPLMLGVGYGRHLSWRLKWYVTTAAGVAFAHARGTGRLKEAFERLGITQVGVKVSDSFAWRVGGGMWIDLSPRFGMLVYGGYLGVRPDVTVTSSAGDRRRNIDLGCIVTSVGFTYGIF